MLLIGRHFLRLISQGEATSSIQNAQQIFRNLSHFNQLRNHTRYKASLRYRWSRILIAQRDTPSAILEGGLLLHDGHEVVSRFETLLIGLVAFHLLKILISGARRVFQSELPVIHRNSWLVSLEDLSQNLKRNEQLQYDDTMLAFRSWPCWLCECTEQ